MPKKTKRVPKTKPLTISIHGSSLHIDAKFEDPNLSDLLVQAVQRVNGTAAATAAAQSDKDYSGLVELIAELGNSFRKDQVDTLTAMFDTPQKVLFMEILTRAHVAPAAPTA